MVSTDDRCDNLSPYPASFGTTDPVPRLAARRRDEVIYRSLFFDSPLTTLAHNHIEATFELQMRRVDAPHLNTVVTTPGEGNG